jgi:methyl-accepting chemotaxis protein
MTPQFPPKSWFQRLLPRSLWAQTILLLLLALALSSVLVGPLTYSRASEQADRELESRGRSIVQTLERYSDLRLAMVLNDDKQAAPILSSIASEEDQVLYLAIVGPQRNLISYAPSTFGRFDMERAEALHFSPQPGDSIKRFTQPMTRFRGVAGRELEFETPDSAAGSGHGAVIGYVLLGLKGSTRHPALMQTLYTIGVTALGIFTVLILLYLSWVAQRLLRMVRFAQDVASGELRRTLDDSVEDDLGRVAAALSSMAQRTGSVVAQLVGAAQSLSRASTELFESSSRQADNAAKQAASVTEMGATVAELRETFTQATNKAESVIDLARRSEESSSGGANAVKQSIDGMVHIRDQVVAIAETITGLVQRTDQIDAIIEVVTDLAEQSNVLALNAGIEAARAGEHGRGFAVVAREVRSLAERSKESTAQVRTILQDIKLAGRDAVRAIEEGSRRAESGTQVAHAAGDAIQRLGEAIAASSAAAMQIASSTRHQSRGVESIWQATTEIDRIANETAQGIHQIEGAAANLKALSGAMAEIVGRYRIRRVKPRPDDQPDDRDTDVGHRFPVTSDTERQRA